MIILDILLLAQPTLEQLSEPQSISTYLSWDSINQISKLLLINSMSKLEVLTESTQKLTTIFMISLIREDLVVLR